VNGFPRGSVPPLQQWAAAGWTARAPLSRAFTFGSKETDKSSVGISQRLQEPSLSAAGSLRLSQLASNHPAASDQVGEDTGKSAPTEEFTNQRVIHCTARQREDQGFSRPLLGCANSFALTRSDCSDTLLPTPRSSTGSRRTWLFGPLTQHELLGPFYTCAGRQGRAC